MRKNILNKFIFFLVLFLLISCKSLINRPKVYSDCSELEKNIKKQNIEILKLPLQQNFITESNINGKIYSLECRIQYFADTCILCNILSKSLGIEFLKIKITDDSVIFLNRIEKEYYKGLIKEFKKIDNTILNVKILKSIFLGRCYLIDTVSFCLEKNIEDLNNNQIIYNKTINVSLNTCFDFYYKINNKAELLNQKIVKRNNNFFYININYDEFKSIYSIPCNIMINLNCNNLKYKMSISSGRINKLKTNNSKVFIPKNYKSISL